MTTPELNPKVVGRMNLDPWVDKVLSCFRIRSRAIQQERGIPRTVGGQVEFSVDRDMLTKVLIGLCEARVASDASLTKESPGGIILPGR